MSTEKAKSQSLNPKNKPVSLTKERPPPNKKKPIQEEHEEEKEQESEYEDMQVDEPETTTSHIRSDESGDDEQDEDYEPESDDVEEEGEESDEEEEEEEEEDDGEDTSSIVKTAIIINSKSTSTSNKKTPKTITIEDEEDKEERKEQKQPPPNKKTQIPKVPLSSQSKKSSEQQQKQQQIPMDALSSSSSSSPILVIDSKLLGLINWNYDCEESEDGKKWPRHYYVTSGPGVYCHPLPFPTRSRGGKDKEYKEDEVRYQLKWNKLLTPSMITCMEHVDGVATKDEQPDRKYRFHIWDTTSSKTHTHRVMSKAMFMDIIERHPEYLQTAIKHNNRTPCVNAVITKQGHERSPPMQYYRAFLPDTLFKELVKKHKKPSTTTKDTPSTSPSYSEPKTNKEKKTDALKNRMERLDTQMKSFQNVTESSIYFNMYMRNLLDTYWTDESVQKSLTVLDKEVLFNADAIVNSKTKQLTSMGIMCMYLYIHCNPYAQKQQLDYLAKSNYQQTTITLRDGHQVKTPFTNFKPRSAATTDDKVVSSSYSDQTKQQQKQKEKEKKAVKKKRKSSDDEQEKEAQEEQPEKKKIKKVTVMSPKKETKKNKKPSSSASASASSTSSSDSKPKMMMKKKKAPAPPPPPPPPPPASSNCHLSSASYFDEFDVDEAVL